MSHTHVIVMYPKPRVLDTPVDIMGHTSSKQAQAAVTGRAAVYCDQKHGVSQKF